MTIKKKRIGACLRRVLVLTIIRFIGLLKVAINWSLKKDRKKVVYLRPILRLPESRRKHVILDRIKPSLIRSTASSNAFYSPSLLASHIRIISRRKTLSVLVTLSHYYNFYYMLDLSKEKREI